jgi:CheY-like chemotaxis protein
MANILVVYDVEQNILDIKLSLKPVGHQILVAKNVESARTLLAAASLDLVICGAHLNGGTVFDLLNFVRRDLNLRTIPFLLFCCNPTGMAESVNESLRSTAMLLGANKYIKQDVFDAEEFQTLVELILLECPSTANSQSKE